MLTSNDIRTGVTSHGTVWASLKFEAERPLEPGEDSQRAINGYVVEMLHRIYGDANRAVSEMEYAVMSSLRMDAPRDQIAEMFRKLRETIPVK